MILILLDEFQAEHTDLQQVGYSIHSMTLHRFLNVEGNTSRSQFKHHLVKAVL